MERLMGPAPEQHFHDYRMEFTSLLVRACRRCDRHGRLSMKRLLAQYGPDVSLRDIMPDQISDCPNRDSTHQRWPVAGGHVAAGAGVGNAGAAAPAMSRTPARIIGTPLIAAERLSSLRGTANKC